MSTGQRIQFFIIIIIVTLHVTDEPNQPFHTIAKFKTTNIDNIEDEDRLEMCCGKMLIVRFSRPNPIIYWISVVIQQTPPKPV